MFKKIIRELGFMLIANSVMFTPLIAAADDGNPAVGVAIGAPVGALITGSVLVSMSRNKSKATKADKYVQGQLRLKKQTDVFLRTETSKRKIDN